MQSRGQRAEGRTLDVPICDPLELTGGPHPERALLDTSRASVVGILLRSSDKGSPKAKLFKDTHTYMTLPNYLCMYGTYMEYSGGLYSRAAAVLVAGLAVPWVVSWLASGSDGRLPRHRGPLGARAWHRAYRCLTHVSWLASGSDASAGGLWARTPGRVYPFLRR